MDRGGGLRVDEIGVAAEIHNHATANQVAQRSAPLGNAGRAVQGNGLPYRVHYRAPAAVFGQQGRRYVSALDFEPLLARGRGTGAQIVEYAAQKQSLTVVIGARAHPLMSGEQFTEQVAAHTVVEHGRRLGGLRQPDRGLRDVGVWEIWEIWNRLHGRTR